MYACAEVQASPDIQAYIELSDRMASSRKSPQYKAVRHSMADVPEPSPRQKVGDTHSGWRQTSEGQAQGLTALPDSVHSKPYTRSP